MIILSIVLALICVCTAAVAVRGAKATKTEREGRTASELALATAQNELSRTAAELDSAKSALDAAQNELSRCRVENARLEERLNQSVNEHARLAAESEERFRSLANKVLLASTENLQRQNSQGIADALRPVKENFEQFRQLFDQRTQRDAADRDNINMRIRELVDLNNRIGQETVRLTNALKGNSKMQGDWGEMILQTILEHCGLQEGREFTTQKSIVGVEGRRLRPDVVINYTDGRKIVVDSKVSIQAYLGMMEADSDERRNILAREHVGSVRKHIAELRDKKYQDLVGKAQIEFVLMFIPNEGAYLAAMQAGGDELWESAYAANVLIVSPTHLMGVVRLVEQMWRHDRQEKNSQEIARQAGAMLDKLRGFLEDMDRIDKSLNDARSSWNDAFNKLSTGTGNLIGRAQRLGELGAKAKKALPARYLPESTPEKEE